jgi:hypothetical protein
LLCYLLCCCISMSIVSDGCCESGVPL